VKKLRKYTLLSIILVTTILVSGCTGSLVRPAATSEPESVSTEIAPATQTPPVSTEVPPTATPLVVSPEQASWPTNPEEAARLFGADASRWEITPDGGWHLLESHERTLVNPAGFVLEGYYDQNPGKDPRQFVSVVAIELQGCTVWPLNPSQADDLFVAMATQKRYTATQADEFIDKVGW